MRRAIALLTSTTFLAACAPPPAPPREPPAHLLLAEAAPGPVPSSAQPGERQAANESQGGHAVARAIGWYSIAVGAGAGLVALGTSLMMLHQNDLRNADCNAAKVCSTDGLNANAQLDGLAGWNVGSFIVAAAGLGIGTILVLTNPKDRKDGNANANANGNGNGSGDRKASLEVGPTGSGAGLVLRSTF